MPQNCIGPLFLPLALISPSGVPMAACIFGVPACSGTCEGCLTLRVKTHLPWRLVDGEMAYIADHPSCRHIVQKDPYCEYE